MRSIRQALAVLLCLVLAGPGGAWAAVAAPCAVSRAPTAGPAYAHRTEPAHAARDADLAATCAACTAGLECHCSAPAVLHAAVPVLPALPSVLATAGERQQLTGVRGGAIWRPPTSC
jgi:hypothetical protein